MSRHAQVARRLRPYLFTNFRRPHRSFSRVAALRAKNLPTQQVDHAGREVTKDYVDRVAHLGGPEKLAQSYPRLPPRFPNQRMTIHAFRRVEKNISLSPGETAEEIRSTVVGRIRSIRKAGSKLWFVDIEEDGERMQVMCRLKRIEERFQGEEDKLHALKDFTTTARKGDWCGFTGNPSRSSAGELSIDLQEVPRLLSPSLHQIPEKLDDAETRARSRHVDMLVNPTAIQTLRVRHQVERQLSGLLNSMGFIKVNTPILTSGAGGAVARPFETQATELEGTLNLRIAPELWLKRLIVGGLPKIYEIGPAFRNEGVDATHNPEFTICEFYEAFADLGVLMDRTRQFLQRLDRHFHSEHASYEPPLPDLNMDFTRPFPCISFIPMLEKILGITLPDLSDPATATPALQTIFSAQQLPLPANPTLPRLLDALAAQFLEPLCDHPTFITEHPACLSPLSKHYKCPFTHQTVAARAELFIHAREYANMYEEENSPFAQREKFLDQLKFREVDGEGDGKAEVDEAFLEALEWGLPPTGGWGCGIDRLVMLFSGRERMADVLAFGSLRNVVGLAANKSKKTKAPEDVPEAGDGVDGAATLSRKDAYLRKPTNEITKPQSPDVEISAATPDQGDELNGAKVTKKLQKTAALQQADVLQKLNVPLPGSVPLQNASIKQLLQKLSWRTGPKRHKQDSEQMAKLKARAATVMSQVKDNLHAEEVEGRERKQREVEERKRKQREPDEAVMRKKADREKRREAMENHASRQAARSPSLGTESTPSQVRRVVR